jgi:hypothetical protein
VGDAGISILKIGIDGEKNPDAGKSLAGPERYFALRWGRDCCPSSPADSIRLRPFFLAR